MKKLILLRGPSGTGKSTIARSIAMQHDGVLTSAHHETDQFWINGDGSYKFNPRKLSDAHHWNQVNTEKSMVNGINIIIVSNTFIARWEMEAYIALAREYDYELEIIRTPGPWDADILFKRNMHDVPLKTIQRQISNYTSYAEETEWTNMSIFTND